MSSVVHSLSALSDQLDVTTIALLCGTIDMQNYSSNGYRKLRLRRNRLADLKHSNIQGMVNKRL